MTLKKFFSLFAAVALLASVGCEDKHEEGGKATFKLDTTELNIGSAGGAQEVKYTIANPQSGAVVLTNCTESWIKDLSTATYGSITFTVVPNYKQEAREAKISVAYTAVDEKYEIVVKQEASNKAPFTFEVAQNNPTELVINIDPADLSTAYVCQIHTKEYIDTFGLNDDYNLISNDMKVFENVAYTTGQTLLNYLQNISYKGKAFDVAFTGLTPDTDYVVYSYHIDLSNGDAIGDVHREVVHTAKPENIDVDIQMTFDINGAHVQQTVTPSNEDVYYYIGYMAVNDFKTYYGASADMAETFVAKWNGDIAIKLNQGYYASQILEEYGKKGTQTFDYNSLKAETEYVFYAFALSSETAFAASDIVLETITTESAQASGMTISIEVKDILATTANVYWTASDAEGKFARSVFTKSEFDALGSTDEQKLAVLTTDYWLYEAVGSTDMNLSNLVPNTTYVAFAYGLDGETPNTEIFTKEFTTKANVAGTSDIAITLGQHFNIDEAAEVDPEHWGSFAGWDDYALVPVTISGVSESDEVYWTLTQFPTDYYNYDDEWIRDLTTNEFYHQNLYSNTYFQLPYEKDYSLIAVAKDANGNFGKLLKMEIYLYKSDAADISSYVYIEEK